MSVRRLADISEQPATFAFNAENSTWAERTIAKYPEGREQSAVIPLMMRAQEQEGWVTKAAIEKIADMLEMPYIRVLEVATFYTQFQLKPVGTRAHIQVCGTTPCMLRGSEDLMNVCRNKIHHDQFHTNEDGTLSWEEVECLGACVNAPMVAIFKDTYEDLTPERLEEIIDAFEQGKGADVPVGPQNGRIFSAPLTGQKTLLDETAVLKVTRDRIIAEEKAAADAAAPAPEAEVAPSNAAKPKTDALETNPAIKSPSPEKASPEAEKAASAAAPAHNPAAANKAEPALGGEEKQRKSRSPKSEQASLASPELLRDEPIGAAGKKPAKTEKPALDHPDRPAGIEKPAAVDDLKMISGVGPKIEGILHSLGIYTFAQIAEWNDSHRGWVDSYLNFKGRIDRDDWVKQAEALHKGGVEEYVRVFGKKPV
ncbi:NADH-quinone oxidoreductase subunit E [Mesorhizobium sp. VNQ89]|uniref:NADH-quinone oxidoreductase subunit E n=1 Tax=Mesorhizobium quangtriensis TaxID=3157709 RepID=UPI0032B84116